MKRSARYACARFSLESLRGQSRRRRDRPMTEIAYVGLDVHAATITIAPLEERQRSRRSGRPRTTRLRSGRRSSRLPRAVRCDAAPFRDMVARLSCLRGISTLAARVIVSEVYDLRRFATASQFMAFLGVVPSEHSSGQKQRRGRRHHQVRQRACATHPRRGRVGMPSLPEGDHAPAQHADASAADRRRRVSQGEPATHQAIPSTRGPGETITRRDHRDCPRARRIHLAVARVDSA